MNARFQAINRPARNTAVWVQLDDRYKSRRNREVKSSKPRILWIKGKPASGKSTIMKSMMEQIRFETQATAVKYDREVNLTASFFFNTKGVRLEKTRLGLYRHLVHQLVSSDHRVRQWFLDLCEQHTPNPETAGVQEAAVYRWHEDELEAFLENVYGKHLLENTKTVFWIDALDECQNADETDATSSEARIVVQFFAALLEIASLQGNSLDICITGRSNLALELHQAWEIVVDQ